MIQLEPGWLKLHAHAVYMLLECQSLWRFSEDKPQNPHQICLDQGMMPQNHVPASSTQKLEQVWVLWGRFTAFHLGSDWDKEPLRNHVPHISQNGVPWLISRNQQSHCEPRTEAGWVSTLNPFAFPLPKEWHSLSFFIKILFPPLMSSPICNPGMVTQYHSVPANPCFQNKSAAGNWS